MLEYARELALKYDVTTGAGFDRMINTAIDTNNRKGLSIWQIKASIEELVYLYAGF